MLAVIRSEVLAPIVRRIGTGASAYVIGVGASAQSADAIGLAIVALMGLGLDLFASYAERNQ